MKTILESCQALIATLPPRAKGSWALEVDAFYHSYTPWLLAYDNDHCMERWPHHIPAILESAYQTYGPFGLRTNARSGYAWTDLSNVVFCKDPTTPFSPFRADSLQKIELVRDLLPFITPWPFSKPTFSLQPPQSQHERLMLETFSKGLIERLWAFEGMALHLYKTKHGLFLLYQDLPKPLFFFESAP